ncbi:hypothetical protein TSUD_26130 [Trifolium subterraneum]|uniref:Uncharacterized protein n=1 Tax=Trifolium subterraneum TaxID=3900 RepID=A0A2Z6NHQ2_TRISU|nr:hypothetical protein TSUD_26130 [Trifolium subterraneum]
MDKAWDLAEVEMLWKLNDASSKFWNFSSCYWHDEILTNAHFEYMLMVTNGGRMKVILTTKQEKTCLNAQVEVIPDPPQLPPFFLRKPSSHSNDDIVDSLFLSLFKFYIWFMMFAMGTQNAVSSHGSMCIDDKEEPWVGSLKPKTFS